jgi:hypothetical protein
VKFPAPRILEIESIEPLAEPPTGRSFLSLRIAACSELPCGLGVAFTLLTPFEHVCQVAVSQPDPSRHRLACRPDVVDQVVVIERRSTIAWNLRREGWVDAILRPLLASSMRCKEMRRSAPPSTISRPRPGPGRWPVLANRPYAVLSSKHGSCDPRTTTPSWKTASVGQFGGAEPGIA